MKRIEFGSPKSVEMVKRAYKLEKNARAIKATEAEISSQEEYIRLLESERDDISLQIDDVKEYLAILKLDLGELT